MSGDAPGDAVGLPRAALEAIYRHARAEFPNECCGFILGAGEAAEVVACANDQDRYHAVDPETYPRTAATAYTFGAKDLRRLADSLDSDTPATIVYHSHPKVGAYFSDEDERAAIAAGWPVDYLVIDCQADSIPGALLFRKHPDAPRYVQIAAYEGGPF